MQFVWQMHQHSLSQIPHPSGSKDFDCNPQALNFAPLDLAMIDQAQSGNPLCSSTLRHGGVSLENRRLLASACSDDVPYRLSLSCQVEFWRQLDYSRNSSKVITVFPLGLGLYSGL